MRLTSRYHAVPITLFLLLLSLSAGCRRDEPSRPPGQQVPFRICVGGILAPLPFIAQEKGFFQAEGVAAEVSLLGDGKAAMNGFFEGKCEAVLSGEFPVVRQSFDRNDLAVIATLTSSDNAVKVFARRDRGIVSPADLVGKKVGVSKGTISNFFLDQFLKKNSIPRERLTIVDISHQTIADSLNRGEIDAYAGSDVAYLKGRKLLGDRGVTFTEPGLTNHAACLTVGKEWLARNPQVAQGVLRALLKAEKELAVHAEADASLLAGRLNVGVEDFKSIMAEQHNRVSLDHVLILGMEDEARWMQEIGMVTGKPLPNVLHVIDPSPLKSLSPGAVNLK